MPATTSGRGGGGAGSLSPACPQSPTLNAGLIALSGDQGAVWEGSRRRWRAKPPRALLRLGDCSGTREGRPNYGVLAPCRGAPG